MNTDETLEERFDREFPYQDWHHGSSEENIARVKAFIRSEVDKAVALREQEIVGEIEKRMPAPMTEEERDKYHCEGSILHWAEQLLATITKKD